MSPGLYSSPHGYSTSPASFWLEKEYDFVWGCSAVCLAWGRTARSHRNLYIPWSPLFLLLSSSHFVPCPQPYMFLIGSNWGLTTAPLSKVLALGCLWGPLFKKCWSLLGLDLFWTTKHQDITDHSVGHWLLCASSVPVSPRVALECQLSEQGWGHSLQEASNYREKLASHFPGTKTVWNTLLLETDFPMKSTI